MKALYSFSGISVLALAVLTTVVISGCGQQTPQSPASGGAAPLEAAPPQPVTSVPPAPAPQPTSAPKTTTDAGPSAVQPAPAPSEQQSPQGATALTAAASDSQGDASSPESQDVYRNLVQLYEKIADLKGSKSPDSKAVAELEKNANDLLRKARVFSYSEKLDLLAFDIQMTSPTKAKVSLLVRANEPLTSDYKVIIGAEVKKDFKELLSPEADVDKLRENISFWPQVRSTNWGVRRPVLLSTEANLKAIPYQISVGFGANEPPHMLGGGAQVIGWFGDVD